MQTKFNLGPIFAAFICCGWPLIFHLVVNNWGGMIARIRSIPSRVRNVRIGGK